YRPDATLTISLSCISSLPRTPPSALFPYTTLFRSIQMIHGLSPTAAGLMMIPMMAGMLISSTTSGRYISSTGKYKYFPVAIPRRSEEHTSELQSRFDLVCRLLLEKKTYEDSSHQVC